MEEKFYVYELAYPERMGGEVFYVGKGTGNRIGQHETEAKKGDASYKCEVIREIWDAGEQVVRRKVFETPIEEDAYIYEWVLINLIYKIDNLANIKHTLKHSNVSREIAKLSRPVTLKLPDKLVAAIDEKSYSRPDYFCKLIMLHADIIEQIAQGKIKHRDLRSILPYGKKRSMRPTVVHLSVDILDLLDSTKINRTEVIEHLLCIEEIDLLFS